MVDRPPATTPLAVPLRNPEGVALLFFVAAFPWVLGAMIAIRLRAGAKPEEDAAMLPPADLRLALQIVLACNAAALVIGGGVLVWRMLRRRPWLRLLLGLAANGVTIAAGIYVWEQYLNH